jgi:hypothetical protein
MRYQLILDPCEATSKSYWNKAIAEGNSLMELHRNMPGLDYTQQRHVLDSKTGKRLTCDEFLDIVHRLYSEKYDREHLVES